MLDQGVAAGQPDHHRAILEEQGLQRCPEDHDAEGFLGSETDGYRADEYRGIDDYLIIYVLHPARLRNPRQPTGCASSQEEPSFLVRR